MLVCPSAIRRRTSTSRWLRSSGGPGGGSRVIRRPECRVQVDLARGGAPHGLDQFASAASPGRSRSRRRQAPGGRLAGLPPAWSALRSGCPVPLLADPRGSPRGLEPPGMFRSSTSTRDGGRARSAGRFRRRRPSRRPRSRPRCRAACAARCGPRRGRQRGLCGWCASGEHSRSASRRRRSGDVSSAGTASSGLIGHDGIDCVAAVVAARGGVSGCWPALAGVQRAAGSVSVRGSTSSEQRAWRSR